MLHADDVTASLLRLCTTENISHSGLRKDKMIQWIDEKIMAYMRMMDEQIMAGGKDG